MFIYNGRYAVKGGSEFVCYHLVFGCKGPEVLALAFWVMMPCIHVHLNRYDVIRYIFKEVGCDVKCLLAVCF